MGLEPTLSRATIWRVNQLRYTHHALARLKGFEPLAHGLEGRCSIRLSYRRKPQDGFPKGFAGAQRIQVPLPLTDKNYIINPRECQQIFQPVGGYFHP